MVSFGEGSLNEHTEDMGIEDEDEPTIEQLRATGELDDYEDESENKSTKQSAVDRELERLHNKHHANDEEEELVDFLGPDGDDSSDNEEDEDDEQNSADTTALAIRNDASLSTREQVKQLLLIGKTRKELEDMGYNKNTIRTVASIIKTNSGSNKPVGKGGKKTSTGIPIFAHGSPPEAIIDAIELPMDMGGSAKIFESGMKFGLSTAVLGIRMAQELSGIGVQQAKPLIDMAKSMREGEALTAKNAAGEAASEAAGEVFGGLQPYLQGIQTQMKGMNAPAGQNPMQKMMWETMGPMMRQMMTNMLGNLMPGLQQPQNDGTPQMGESNPSGWTSREE